MSDPYFLSAGKRSSLAPPKTRFQVRLDVPGGVTYAPDQLDPHNSAKRLFVPPPLPERDHAHYDFARAIALHKGDHPSQRAEPQFVLGDDEPTPAEQVVLHTRANEKAHAGADEHGAGRQHAYG
ncbi:hypothetical protein MSPP1_002370 [Malassezia sp. CBS 17886]|nr:hypothetical protein MSPP1_002370 [Malassezia sp. CBS 17886]